MTRILLRAVGEDPGVPAPQLALEAVQRPDNDADAWIEIYRRRADRTIQVDVPDDADPTETRRAHRTALIRAHYGPAGEPRR